MTNDIWSYNWIVEVYIIIFFIEYRWYGKKIQYIQSKVLTYLKTMKDFYSNFVVNVENLIVWINVWRQWCNVYSQLIT